MNQDIIISSDESNFSDEAKGRDKQIKNESFLTSDSDDEKIVFRKVRKSKRKAAQTKMLGEISLLTSDEDDEKPQPKKRKVKKSKNLDNAAEITSDEDYIEEKPPVKTKKRKLEAIKPTQAVKKTRTVAQKAKKVAVKAESINNIPEENGQDISETKLDIGDMKINPAWTDHELLAERSGIENYIAFNLVNLLNDGNTIPFIARYRKNVIGNMPPEELRTVKEEYDDICALKKRISTVVSSVAKLGKLDERLQRNICTVKTSEELEHIFSPFKSVGSKKSLAEKAKQLGLELPALQLLNGTKIVNISDYIKSDSKDLRTVGEVEKNIIYIIASEISTDAELLQFLRDLRRTTTFKLESKKARQTKTTTKAKNTDVEKKAANNEMKFENYFDFSQPVSYLKSHQILAINRGESLKHLSVKVDIPQFFWNKYYGFCKNKWLTKSSDPLRTRLLELAVTDAYNRLIVNLISREIRSELKQKAEKESCKIFSDNLKNLLLTQPLKGKSILAIDPGYTNGCKVALISPTGSLLAHNVIYPHTKWTKDKGEHVIKGLLMKYSCDIIGIGNGTACRETEEWIVSLIKNNFFRPLDINYLIVNEDGASIYSCSPEAQKEFGKLDPNIISAVSLARRIQDPMAELVKVEPSHLGVGMYQLDLKKKQLEEALGEVVSECVSFVGVDLNTASQCLLRRVAGLTDSKASQIILYREKNGPFSYRRQLLQVYGIGERIFEQCAGFLRVGPLDREDKSFYKQKSTTPLDATIIHPESYHIVRSLIGKMDLKEQDVGSDNFILTFKSKSSTLNPKTLADTYKTDPENIQLIFDALSKKLNHDLRSENSNGPLFRRDVTSFEELRIDMTLTGRVNNVTSFGAFVDLGVGHNGLLHNRFMKGISIRLGDVIEVKVTKVDFVKKHIGLEVVRKM